MRTVNDPRFRAILENVTYGIVTIDDPSSVPPSAVVLRPVLPPSAVMLRRTGRSPASPPVLRSATEDGKAMPEAVATDDGRTGARAVANLASPAIARFTKAGEALARPPSGVVRRTGRRLRRVEAGTVVSFNHVAEGLFQPRGRRPGSTTRPKACFNRAAEGLFQPRGRRPGSTTRPKAVRLFGRRGRRPPQRQHADGRALSEHGGCLARYVRTGQVMITRAKS